MAASAVFQSLNSAVFDAEEVVASLMDAIAANANLADERTKTKLFRTPLAGDMGETATKKGDISKNAASLTEKWWNRYVLSSAAGTELEDLLPKSVRYVSGISISMERRSPLVQLMLVEEQRENNIGVTKLLEALTTDQIAEQKHEFIDAVIAYYEEIKSDAPAQRASAAPAVAEAGAAVGDDDGGGGSGERDSVTESQGKVVVIGSKEVFSALQSAVKHRCEAGVAALLGSSKCDPLQGSQKFALHSTSYTARMLRELGGAAFFGMKKVVDQDFAARVGADVGEDRDDDDAPAAGRMKGAGSIAVGRVDLAAVPSLQAMQPSWRAKKSHLPMTPLMLAFQAEHRQILQQLLGVQRVEETCTPLVLQSGGDPAFHEELKRLQRIPELTLRIPNGTGPVPAVLFELTQLQRLCMRDCGYSSIPTEIAQLSELRILDVANMPLKELPAIALSRLPALQSVDCSGIKLATPPVEIVQRGPEVVAQYIQDLGQGAKPNHDVLLMFIGDGEAGE